MLAEASPNLRASDSPTEAVRRYWNEHIHDLEIVSHLIGSPSFFQELERYRFEKLGYLPGLVEFESFAGKRVLEVGCGAGTDLARFAKGGAEVVGIDLADVSIDLARRNFKQRGLSGEFHTMDGENMSFGEESFDLVYAHGVLQYTADIARMVTEIHRVLRSDGQAILMVYNRRSWLRWMSKLTGTQLEHQDAPFYRMLSIREFRDLLEPFRQVKIVLERFPVRTELHTGWRAALYNHVFVNVFNLMPKALIGPLGWHLVAFAHK